MVGVEVEVEVGVGVGEPDDLISLMYIAVSYGARWKGEGLFEDTAQASLYTFSSPI
jgi:hypothetical protein